MKKRITSIIISVMMIISIIPMTVYAESYSGKCGDNLTWELDSETGTLTVSGQGDMDDYDTFLYDGFDDREFAEWKPYRSLIKKVVVENGVTSIGSDAFLRCENLTEVVLPDGLTDIGNEAFMECKALTDINIPDSVTTLGSAAFSTCISLKAITVPDSVIDYGDGLFSGCISLEKVNIPEGIEAIDKGTFSGCASLKSVDLPSSIKTIGANAFGDCEALESIVIPDGAEYIELNAFNNCKKLADVTIPDSVTYVDNKAFDGTPWFDAQPDGLVYIGKCAYRYKGEMPENTNITLDDDTTGLSPYAFSGQNNLVSLTIPETVTRIGGYALNNCSSLNEINVPDSVELIGENALHGTGWYDAQPDGFIYAGRVVYGYKGDKIEVKELTFRENTISVADGAFIYYGDDIPDGDDSPYRDIESLVLPEGMKYIGDLAFCDWKGLKTIKMPDSIEEIGTSAFANDISLKEVTLPKNIKEIGWNVFDGCAALETVYIGKNVLSIGDDAFKDCTSIKNVYYSGTEEEWKKIEIGTGNDSLIEADFKFGGIIIMDIPFEDVPGDSWFTDSVMVCFLLGFMTGTSENTFSPNMTLTRAQIVQILAKMAQAELDDYPPSGKFTDVAEDAWYAKAVEWAVQNGITSGTSEYTFSPNEPVTREQLAVFLKALAEYLGYDTSASTGVGRYSDADQISSWAIKALKWATAKNLITGTSETTLDPKSTATRAQTAVIIIAFMLNNKQT